MKFFNGVFSLFLSTQALAFTCYVSISKAPCWQAYDVKVDLSDAATAKRSHHIEVLDGDLHARGKFDCYPNQNLSFEATFSPEIWEGEANKVYHGIRFLKLPHDIRSDETGWHIKICFPKDFSNLPTPPDPNTDCECDLAKIPKIEPKI